MKSGANIHIWHRLIESLELVYKSLEMEHMQRGCSKVHRRNSASFVLGVEAALTLTLTPALFVQ